jgi:SAM-dependent methyltransferase
MKPCPHHWLPCPIPDYVLCHLCQSYKSLAPADPADLYRHNYWSHERGHSTLREQIHNVNTHAEGTWSKNEYVLNLVDVAEGDASAIEVGCAPGILLGRLKREKGFAKVVGVEVDSDDEADIRDIAGTDVELRFGLFPASTRSLRPATFALFVALDVFEHSPEPEAFLAEAARLLKPGGQLIIMAPLVGSGHMPERMFAPAEHVFLHSLSNMAAMLGAAGFGRGGFSCWTEGHEVVQAWRCEA